ncbi:C3 and PZP-like alpha-2-macroglobulin domain-containing protein 8 [Takifugu flavidus]|uniref:C3 and PZP-like alpha-2-macroglobulin domain-containing protein 8 n=1 Tax=Takifugu flavidus TaxID=433684 RepID=A0A5C6MSZ0_9TELE|nr:C3 and PZP-like alpha-2-macroglobulin domain-containing protein 8 [Takifugu flavidus]
MSDDLQAPHVTLKTWQIPDPSVGRAHKPALTEAKMLQLPLTAWSLSWTLFICSVTAASAQERQGYLVAAPSVFRAGVEESVSITIFGARAETRVQVQLLVKGQTVTHAHGSVLDKGTIKLKVPSGLRGQAHLKVWGNRHLAEGGYIFHNYTTITVESKGTAVFIQTDKPVYKPKHRVLINVYTVTPDLRPVNDKIEAYVLVSGDLMGPPRGSGNFSFQPGSEITEHKSGKLT